MINVILCGRGRMGSILADEINESEELFLAQTVGKTDAFSVDGDVLIDFSSPAALDKIFAFCSKRKIPAVIATTGYNDSQFKKIVDLSKNVPVLYSQNMSAGIAAMCGVIKNLALTLPDCDVDIIETHHKKKADSPSGTALVLSSAISEKRPLKIVCGDRPRGENELRIHSVRAGNYFGEHEVIFSLEDEIITVSHKSLSRRIFALGAIRAAKFLIGKPPMLYSINDLLF